MKLKTKDYIFLGMATVLSLVIYMIAMVLSSFLGAFGHSISPGIWGLLGGVVFVYICYNFNKFGIFTVFIALHMIIFSIMGGSYLPWWITSLTGAILADLVLKTVGYNNIISQCLWIPIVFFADSYKSDWVARGQSVEAMDASIKYGSGSWLLLGIFIIIVLSSLGVIIGRKILNKYQRK